MKNLNSKSSFYVLYWLVSFFFGCFKAIFYFTLRQKMQFSRKIGLTAKWVFNRWMQWNGKYFYSLLSFLYWFVGNTENKTKQKVMQMCKPMRNGHRLSIAIWERFLIFLCHRKSLTNCYAVFFSSITVILIIFDILLVDSKHLIW